MQANDSLEYLTGVEAGSKEAGIDLRRMARDRAILDRFGVDATRGSRNTVAGGAAGAIAGELVSSAIGLPGGGSLIGAGIGALRGHRMDRLGGLAVKAQMDFKTMLFKEPKKFLEAVTPYIPQKTAKALADALARGNKAFAVTHHLLSQQSQEYREALENLNKDDK